MFNDIPEAGSADAEVQALARSVWIETALSRRIDLTGFDPRALLSERLAWAIAHDFEVGGLLARFSSKMRHNTHAQVHDTVHYAVSHQIYVPPEFVCIDDAVSGRRVRRDGLARMVALLKAKRCHVLLVFKMSRLFRESYLGIKFFQEVVVNEGLRAISISQGIDTADKESWKQLAFLQELMKSNFTAGRRASGGLSSS